MQLYIFPHSCLGDTSTTLSGLLPGALYAVRIVLQSAAGTTNGAVALFSTLPSDMDVVQLTFEADYYTLFPNGQGNVVLEFFSSFVFQINHFLLQSTATCLQATFCKHLRPAALTQMQSSLSQSRLDQWLLQSYAHRVQATPSRLLWPKVGLLCHMAVSSTSRPQMHQVCH